ncbi:polysaccharide lyase family 7 protein [Kibdelosporangium aridum]|uniref:Alginate lyase 2 domain-containing protein n=1 Tax=Kibdelosporangium aridum TaxID=2030 RepID=A0A1W2FW86_KIBAR|nr:polysaccharide lyase family 7 protein [Kibdelosporangium aridum]SMD26143.1 hypothetical protein SAMN05661093_09723 [Kibdelosporangium aridum]
MQRSRAARWTVAVAAAMTVTLPAPAMAEPIGSGWTQVNPAKKIQVVSGGVNHPHNWNTTTHAEKPGASYDRSGGVETFRLLSTKSNRVEVRVQNDYRTGLRQFEGELRVTAPTNDESCMQIFGNDGAGATTLMIRAFSANGGELRDGSSRVLTSGIYNKWVRINVIHDGTANKVSIYVNGALKITRSGPPGDHYFKYGVYGTLKTASAQTQWRNVKFYQKWTPLARPGETVHDRLIEAGVVGRLAVPSLRP